MDTGYATIYTISNFQKQGIGGFYKQTCGLFEGSIFYFYDEVNAIHIGGGGFKLFESKTWDKFPCSHELWEKMDILQITLL